MFRTWEGPCPEDTYGGKTLLEFGGELVFAEIAILRAWQEIGWHGVWVDTYGGKLRNGYWGEQTPAVLPELQHKLLDKIKETARQRGGCWDVYCWKGSEVVFIEAKRSGEDAIRYSQVGWLDAAIQLGVPQESFLIAEWRAVTIRYFRDSEEHTVGRCEETSSHFTNGEIYRNGEWVDVPVVADLVFRCRQITAEEAEKMIGKDALEIPIHRRGQ